MVTTVVVDKYPRGWEHTESHRPFARPRASDPKPAAERAQVSTELSDSERYRQISLCAYFKAEQRGFAPGHMWDDWLAAEREVVAKNTRSGSKSPKDPRDSNR